MDMTLLHSQHLAEPTTLAGKPGWKLLPENAEQVAQCLRQAAQSGTQLAANLQDARLMDTPVWLDLGRLNTVRRHTVADFTIQVETGLTLGALNRLLAEVRQEFPLSYPPETRLLDILAEDRPALETGLRGYPRDFVLKTEITAPDGQLTVSGADVVKNVTGYDLHKLYVGGGHAFGVITAVTLKLAALPPSREWWLTHPETLSAAEKLVQALFNSHLPLRVCELLRDTQGWQLLLEIAGDDLLLAECQAVMHQLSPQAFQQLGEAHALRLKNNWSALDIPASEEAFQVTVAEISVPLDQWVPLAAALQKKRANDGLRLQIRPAAGLLFLSAPQFSWERMADLSATAERLNGFLQVFQAPDMSRFAGFNLPGTTAEQVLLKTLKKGYDPQSILFCPRFNF